MPILVVTATVSGHISKVYQAMGKRRTRRGRHAGTRPAGEVAGAASLLRKIDVIGRLIGKTPPRYGCLAHLYSADRAAGPGAGLAPLGSPGLVDRGAVRAGGDPLQASRVAENDDRDRAACGCRLRPWAGPVA